ncbi:MAG TPA: class I SAM-dependent methyltransferase [Planctomycetota bacterium]
MARCPLCSSSSLTARLVDFRGHGIDRCRECGVEFMNPQYSDAHLAHFYSRYISMHPGPRDETKHRGDPEVRKRGKRRALDLLRTFAQGPRILMIGCGDGIELAEAKACGWQPEGYDVDPETTAAVAAREGVPVHCGTLASLPGRAGPFDALFLDQVIEHPKDPGRCLEVCRDLLRPGGVLFLATPNLGSVSNVLKTFVDRLGLRRRPGRHYNTRHHLAFFRPRVLADYLRNRLGFDVLRVRASLKPQRNPVTALLGGLFAGLDSNFVVVARRPAR